MRSACARWRESLETYREYNGFAAEAILVILLPAPARARGNQARQLAPRARAAARARANYEIHRECDGSAGPRSVRAARSSGGRKSAKPSARTLRARSGMDLRLRPPLRKGKRSHFFGCFLFAGVRSEGETLAFFRLFPLRSRVCGRGGSRLRAPRAGGCSRDLSMSLKFFAPRFARNCSFSLKLLYIFAPRFARNLSCRCLRLRAAGARAQ